MSALLWIFLGWWLAGVASYVETYRRIGKGVSTGVLVGGAFATIAGPFWQDLTLAMFGAKR